MLAVLARFARRLSAAYHSACGRILWRLRAPRRARHHFERVLALGGNEFAAYVHLARIALGDGDYAGYRREMSNARGCDPERFARLRIPTAGLEPRVAGTPFEETGERATWRSVRPGNGLARRPAVRSAELPTDLEDQRFGQSDTGFDALDGTFDSAFFGGLGDDAAREERLDEFRNSLGGFRHQRRDDFNSSVERERFRRLPPIEQDEVRDTDVDDLIRRLGG